MEKIIAFIFTLILVAQGGQMSTVTTNYGLAKPDGTDYYNVSVQNGNMDAIDTQLKADSDAFDMYKQLSSSISKIPLINDFRAWQGVTVYNDLIYLSTDRNENFELENIISVYTLSGKFVKEKRNAYTETDLQEKFMSFGSMTAIDGYLYGTFYNYNSSGSPLVSRIVKFNVSDLTVNQVYEIGGNVAESVTKYNDAYWVVYHDVAVVKKFDLSFNFVQQYDLDVDDHPWGLFQGSLWDGNYFYANLHGNNIYSDTTTFTQLRKYEFDGTNFNFIKTIEPPTDGCGQGVFEYKGYYFWNDRPNNLIVITKDIEKCNVYSENLPFQNEWKYKPILLNGWDGYDTVFDRPARVKVLNGVVYLSGIIKNPAADTNTYNGTTPIFQIPERYTPKYSLNFLAITSAGPVRIPIAGRNNPVPTDAGKVYIDNILEYPLIHWVSLDGISYPITD